MCGFAVNRLARDAATVFTRMQASRGLLKAAAIVGAAGVVGVVSGVRDQSATVAAFQPAVSLSDR